MPIWNNIFNILQQQKQILKEMTTTTTTALKSGRKVNPTIMSTLTTTSSMAQKTIEETLPTEKSTSISNANIQAMFLTLQDSLTRLQETMIKNHSETRADINELKEEMGKLKTEMKADISKVEDKVGVLQQALEKNEVIIKEVEKRTERTERELERVDEDFKSMSKEMEDSLVLLEMDKAATYLRFQNVTESKEEDLEYLMAEILAGLLKMDKDEIQKEFDEVYRVNTNYARRHNCSREVHIRFTRRCVRDMIYRTSRDKTITYKEKDFAKHWGEMHNESWA